MGDPPARLFVLTGLGLCALAAGCGSSDAPSAVTARADDTGTVDTSAASDTGTATTDTATSTDSATTTDSAMSSDSDASTGGAAAWIVKHAVGATLYLANVHVEPNWPTWISYAETNKDGLVLDDAAAIYAEDLTVKNWNADGAIDNKAKISQFVRLKLEGKGNRGIRYWNPGPHYLVQSTLQNTGGRRGQPLLVQ